MKDNYITAVLEELNAGMEPEKVLLGLEKTLKRKGHTRLYASILRGVVTVLEAGSTDQTTATVATERDTEIYKEAIEKALQELGSKDKPTIIVDRTIVGGFIAEAKSKRIDASYKSKLVTLYRSLTK